MSGLEIIAWIVIPLCIFLFGVAVASVKGIIGAAQHLAHAEESLDKVAESNEAISSRLGSFIEKSDSRWLNHEQRISHAEYILELKKA